MRMLNELEFKTKIFNKMVLMVECIQMSLSVLHLSLIEMTKLIPFHKPNLTTVKQT